MTRISRTFVGVCLATSMLLAFGTAASAAAAGPMAVRLAQTPAPKALNLNSATVEDLQKLPGVGPATAERIVEYRQKAGGFKKVEELMNVKGIGEKTFLKLKPLVTVTPTKSVAR